MKTLWQSLILMPFLVLCSIANGQGTPASLPQLMRQFQDQVAGSKIKEAANTLTDVIALADQMMGSGHPQSIGLRLTQGSLQRQSGQMDKALVTFRETQALSTSKLGASHALTAASINGVGTIYHQRGDLAKARLRYEQALKILRSTTGSEKQKAEVHGNFSDLLSKQADYEQARAHLSQALDLNRSALGADHPNTMATVNNMGMLLMSMGDYDGSETWLQDALTAYRKRYGDDHVETVISLNNLGKLRMHRGDFQESLTFYQQSLAINTKAFGEKHPTSLTISNNIAQLYLDLGRHAEARALLNKTLQLTLASLGPNHPTVALLQHNLGTSFAVDQPDQAIDPLMAATNAYEDDNSNRLTLAASARIWLGVAEANRGNVDQAIKNVTRARRHAINTAWLTLPSLSSNDQQDFMKRTVDWTMFVALSLAAEYPDNQDVLAASAEWLANGKGIAAEALADARRENKRETFEWIDLDRVRKAVAEDSVWVDIARQDMINFHGKSNSEQVGEPHYVAWIVPNEGDVVRVDLGDAKAIDTLVTNLRNCIAKHADKGGLIETLGEIEATKLANIELAKLADFIWSPIQEQLPARTQKIDLCPDGSLWLAPWHALPASDANSDQQMVVHRYTVATHSSGRQFALPPKDRLKRKTQSAIFANPLFDESNERIHDSYRKMFRRDPPRPLSREPSRRSFSVQPLPGTEVEAAAILPSVTKWMSGKTPIQYKGRYALESAAKELVSPDCIVFATHGFFADDKDQVFDPLERCGLLLTGCNNPDAAIGDDNGVLLGSEIADIKLDGTELVVLSACETGVGRIENGNGVAGLRRSFHMAGAKSVVSSLWQIPDFDTAKLMDGFFRQLADGHSKANALQRAQIKRIEARRKANGAAHPFFWAAFSISGK